MLISDQGEGLFSIIFNELPAKVANEDLDNVITDLTREQAYEVQRLAGKMFDLGMKQNQRMVRLAIGIDIGE